jgi:integrase
MAMLALFSTLRISEVLGLRWKHFDFASGLVCVRERYWRGDLDVPKNDRASRDVPMGRLTDEFARIYPGAEAAEEFVFTIRTIHGSTRDDRSIRRYFLRPIAERLGIYSPGFGFHSLRREAVTALAARADPFQAMRAAGHSTMSTTLLYVLSDCGRQEAAIRSAQSAVWVGE